MKIDRLLKRILLVALCAIHSLSLPGAARAEADAPIHRALLVACDTFVEAPDMTPIGENNLRIMETILEQDARDFSIARQYGITSSKETLAAAVDWAFGEAKPGDVSLLYISTHGDFVAGQNNPHGVLLLSDGSLEDRVTAQELNEIFDRVPGTKALLVDACNSGALIGKGVSPSVGSPRVSRTFHSDDYKVLTSSGASEPSWYLSPSLEYAPPGSSYFTTAMAVGAGLIGGYAADRNRDGTITLKEMYDHLWVNQASSAVQMFPQDDSYPLFVYDSGKLSSEPHGELTGFVFTSTVLDVHRPVLEFAYTARVPTRVAYRITYLRDGQWDWVHGETLRDETEWDGDADPMGDVSPGRKQIALDLSELLPEDWTYGTLHVMTLSDGEEDAQPFIYASRVFSAHIKGQDPELAVRAASKWNTRTRRELEIFVKHALPCRLSLSIYAQDGRLVRRLVTSHQTRPQALEPDGSLFYWNGLDGLNEPAPPGEYVIRATARIGAEEYTAEKSVLLQ